MGLGSRFEQASPAPAVASLGRGDERHLPRLVELVGSHERDAAAMEGSERRAMTDGDDRRALETLLQKPIKGSLGGFIE